MGTLKLLNIERNVYGEYGFKLKQNSYDPYPFIETVFPDSNAEYSGVLSGDFILEVNERDIVGLTLNEIMNQFKETLLQGKTTSKILIWRATNNTKNRLQENVMKFFQKFGELLDCPVCFEPTRIPVTQCANGHILCKSCRIKTERCPICRVPLGTRGSCLFADRLIETFFELFSTTPKLSSEITQNDTKKVVKFSNNNNNHSNNSNNNDNGIFLRFIRNYRYFDIKKFLTKKLHVTSSNELNVPCKFPAHQLYHIEEGNGECVKIYNHNKNDMIKIKFNTSHIFHCVDSTEQTRVASFVIKWTEDKENFTKFSTSFINLNTFQHISIDNDKLSKQQQQQKDHQQQQQEKEEKQPFDILITVNNPIKMETQILRPKTITTVTTATSTNNHKYNLNIPDSLIILNTDTDLLNIHIHTYD